MSAADLVAHGFTDADLAELARVTLNEEWVPDTNGPSDERRRMFDRIMTEIG